MGLEPVPIRHALTIGEMVAWRADAEGLPPELLRVVSVTGLPREADGTQWGRAFVQPSPNMPTLDTARVYPGGCLLEGTNLSEGRGTTRPFEIVGAPWVDGGTPRRGPARALSARASARVPSPSFPMFHKHAGAICGGVQVHVTRPEAFRPVATYLALIALAHDQDPERFAFRTEKYEFRDDVPAFDLLTGDPDVRLRIARGGAARQVAEEALAVDVADRRIVTEAIEAARGRTA